MLHINSIGVSIDRLFSGDLQYKVPRYQRRYVWDEVDWVTLWTDILFQLGLEFDNESDGESVIKQQTQHEDKLDLALQNEDSGHFTGLFVIRPIDLDDLERYEVIDGQQRLTTFQIIFSVIRDICEAKSYSELVEEMGTLIENQPTVSQRFNEAMYKFIPTNYDAEAFKGVVTGEYGKAISSVFDEEANCLTLERVNEVRSQVFYEPEKVSHNILDAYDKFYRWVRIYIEETCDSEKLDSLIRNIKNRFHFVQVKLDSSHRSEKIFESLNATGKRLKEFDYLRNHLFLRAERLGKAPGKDDSYSDIFYDKYWCFENESDGWEVDQLEAFFRTFLVAKLGPDCFEERKPFEVYQRYSKKLETELKDEFQQLKDYAESYKEMNNPASRVGLHMQFYDCLNLPCLDSLILFGKHEIGMFSDDLHTVCDIFRIIYSSAYALLRRPRVQL